MASVDEEFEYYIKFPNSPADEPIKNESKKLPVIVLLGWAGCQDKYLSKYSAIYEERGLITLRTTAPLQTLFVHRASMADIANKLVSTLYDMNLNQHPLVFHLFSNGGTYLYGHVLKELKSRPLDIRGMIFDSSPGRKRFSSLWGALSAILGGRALSFAAASALVLMWALQTLWYSYILRREEPYGDPFNPLLGDPSMAPQLCLYSMEDKLIAAQDIKEFISERERRGVEVTDICFTESEHVRHLMTHRNVYISSVMTFLKKCLPT